MIQCGAYKAAAELKKVCQSVLDEGEKIFVPMGQLFLSYERRTSRQLLHFTIGPAE
jgi:hypothetical protein